MGPILAAAGLTAGILAVHSLAQLPDPGTLALLAIPALLPWRLRAPWSALVLGAMLAVLQGQARLEQRWPLAQHGEQRDVEGFITTLPERDAQASRFVFEPADAAGAGLPPRIRLGWYDEVAREAKGGQCWRLRLKLRHPHGTLNPGGGDYEGWLFREGIGATATVKDGERCAATGPLLVRLRQAIADRIGLAVPDARAAGLIAALTVGDRSGIAGADWDLFRLTGTTHLVAISGFNIAIVAGLAFFVFRWGWSAWPRLCLRVPAQRVGALGSAITAGAYAALAGLEPPVLRAAIMLWIALAAVALHRRAQASRVLALAWIAVLALDPSAVASPGIWLSFAAVAAIFYTALGRLRPPPAWLGALRLQLLLSLALAPLSLLFFAGVSWIAPLVNLLAVPYFAALTPLALLALGLSWLSAFPLQVTAFTLDLFLRGLERAAAVPAPWVPGAPGFAALLCALSGLVLLLAPRGLPLRPLGLLALVPLALARPEPIRGALELAVLDVGQGLAVVVRTAGHTLVYDGGPAFDEGFDAGESVVVPYVLSTGRRGVDLLVQSHGDRDHSGGVAAIRRLLAVRDERGITRACVEGERWRWDGVDFAVLNGPAPGLSDNDGGCVLRIRGPDFSVLLPADIERGTEARLVARHGAGLRSDLLVAPHHGSKTSSTPEFVAAVSPAVVLYGAGWRHQFRHPRPEVAARYAAIGSRQFVTAGSGALLVRAGPFGPEVEEWRPAARRFWNAEPGP